MQASSVKKSNNNKPQGRPAGPVTTNNRQAILDAAEISFAQKGYAATSLREIADLAGVTPAMIHYYFGSKLALLREVLEQSLEPLAEAIAGMKSADHAPVQDIARLLLQTFGEHPNLSVLVTREVLLPGGVMQAHFREYLAPRLGGSVPGLLEKERSAGRLQPDLDPVFSALSVISLCAFPFMARALVEPVFNMAYDPATLHKLEQHIIDLLDRGFSI